MALHLHPQLPRCRHTPIGARGLQLRDPSIMCFRMNLNIPVKELTLLDALNSGEFGQVCTERAPIGLCQFDCIAGLSRPMDASQWTADLRHQDFQAKRLVRRACCVVVEIVCSLLFGMQQDLSMEVLREATLMLQLSHPNILEIFGLSFRGNSAMIVLEFMTLGNLPQYFLIHPKFVCSTIRSRIMWLAARRSIPRRCSSRTSAPPWSTLRTARSCTATWRRAIFS